MDLNPITHARDVLRLGQPHGWFLRILLAPLILFLFLLWPVLLVHDCASTVRRKLAGLLMRLPGVRRLAGVRLPDVQLTQRRTEATEALDGMRRWRRLAVPAVVLEWSALISLGAGSGLGLLGHLILRASLVARCAMLMLVCAGSAWVLRVLYARNRKAWQQAPGLLCSVCGYDRSGSAATYCSECGTRSPGLDRIARQKACSPWDPFVDDSAVMLPIALVGSLSVLIAWLSVAVSPALSGGALLALTVSVAALVAHRLLVAVRVSLGIARLRASVA
jgi:hypothetical protein